MLFSQKFFQSLICLVIASVFSFLVHNPDLPTHTTYWFCTVFVISLTAFEIFNISVAILILCLSYIVLRIAPPAVVFQGWLTPIPWVCFGGMLLGILMDKTNLATRIALFILCKIGKTPLRLICAFFIAGIIISALIPDTITVLIVFMAIAVSICKSLNLAPNSKESATIILGAFFGAYISSSLYLPNGLGLITFNMVKKLGIENSWLGFFMDCLLYRLTHFSVALGLLYIFGANSLAPHITACIETASKQYEKLGKLSFAEKKVLILACIALAGFVLEPLHKLPSYFLFTLIILLGFVPFINIFESDDLKKVNYPILLFIIGCIAIGTVAETLGIPKILSSKILPMLHTVTDPLIANLYSYMLGVMANFLLTPVAAASSLSIPIAQIAMDLELSVKPLLYSFLFGLDQFILPYELAPALIMFSTGYVRLRYIILIMSCRLVLVPLGIILSTYFVW